MQRFPVPSLLLFVGAALSQGKDAAYWVFWGAAAFLAALIGQLWSQAQAERAGASLRPSIVAALAAMIVVGLMVMQIVTIGGERWPYLLHMIDFGFLFVGLTVLLPVAPFLGRRFSIEVLWRFGLDVLLAMLACLGVSLVISAGLGLAGLSVEFLFDFDARNVLDKLFPVVPWFSAFLALGLLPDYVGHQSETTAFTYGVVDLLLRFLNWVVVPLLLVHGAILNLYALSILISWELPHGGVGWMVGSFVSIGTLVWLLVQVPVQSGEGGRFVRWFARGWWWLLIAPFGLLVIGVWWRITDYGVTPPRYLLAEMTIWTAFALVLWLWRGIRTSNRALLGVAVALFLFGALAGPFSARNLSLRSQLGLLRGALEKRGLLDKQGHLMRPVPKGIWDKDDWRHLNSIMDELFALAGDDAVLALVRPVLKEKQWRAIEDERRSKSLVSENNPLLWASYVRKPTKLHELLSGVLALDDYDSGQTNFFIATKPLVLYVPAGMRLVMDVELLGGQQPVWIGSGLRLRKSGEGMLLLERLKGDASQPSAHGMVDNERMEVVWRLSPARLKKVAGARMTTRYNSKVATDSVPLDVTMMDGSHLLVKEFEVGSCLAQKKNKTYPCIKAIMLSMLLPEAQFSEIQRKMVPPSTK